MGKFGRVGIFRKIAFALCSLKAATQRNLHRRPTDSHFLPSRRISAGQCALNEKASRWNPTIFRHPGRAGENLFDHVPGLRRCERFAKPGDRTVHVSIESFAKEPLFIAKRGVKTWSIDSHGPGEMGE